MTYFLKVSIVAWLLWVAAGCTGSSPGFSFPGSARERPAGQALPAVVEIRVKSQRLRGGASRPVRSRAEPGNEESNWLRDNLRTNPVIRKNLDEERVRHSTIDDVNLFHARLEGVESGIHLGYHPRIDRSIGNQFAALAFGE